MRRGRPPRGRWADGRPGAAGPAGGVVPGAEPEEDCGGGRARDGMREDSGGGFRIVGRFPDIAVLPVAAPRGPSRQAGRLGRRPSPGAGW